MNPLDVVKTEARQHRTVMLTARESDGSVETREAEPYSLRPGGADRPSELRLFYYCLKKGGIRNTYVTNISAAIATGNTFEPRWPVEL